MAQGEEIQQLIAGFQSRDPEGNAVAQIELLVRTAVFKSANELVGWLLQQAAERIDASYQPKPGEVYKSRETIRVQGIFGSFEVRRDYYYHAGKKQGHYPADAALGLEVGYTPALAKLLCLEGADETTYLKAERHLEQTGGIKVSARQIQRVVHAWAPTRRLGRSGPPNRALATHRFCMSAGTGRACPCARRN